MKILLHAPSGYTFFFNEVMRIAREDGTPIDFGVVLYSDSDGLLKDISSQVGAGNLLYLQEQLNDRMRSADADLDLMHEFPASLFECVSTSKIMTGHIDMQSKPRFYQRNIVANTYLIYKDFLSRWKPDLVFFPIIEGYDSLVLYHLCREIGVLPVIYGHGRNIGVSYFSSSIHEDLPPYVLSGPIPDDLLSRACEFIAAFRQGGKPAFEISYRPSPQEVIPTARMHRSLPAKALRFLRIRLGRFEPHLMDRYTLLHNLRIHFHGLTMRYRRWKGDLVYRFFYDLRSVDTLPRKFVYYPLQYTPETSINTPAPYFIDQLRAIDLILTNLPADHYLVIKEHPAMRGERPVSFYRELRRRPNVVLADFALPGRELIERAAVTVSVTGTSCLEAFLLGRPALHLSRSFFTDWIGSFDSFSGFRGDMRSAMQAQVPQERIVDLVARTFLAGYDFIIYAPNDPYRDPSLLMNTRNIREMLRALLDHAQRLRELPKGERT